MATPVEALAARSGSTPSQQSKPVNGHRFSHEFEELFDHQDKLPLCGFAGYLVLFTMGIAGWSFLACLLWSSMWISITEVNHPSSIVREHYWLSSALFCASIALATVLYLLDFFMPAHLPGQRFILWKNDRVFGRCLLVVAVMLFIGGSIFMAQNYPNVPLLISIFLCPGVALCIRLLTRPHHSHSEADSTEDHMDFADVDGKIRALKRLVGQSDDVLNFYKALATAFFLSSALVLGVWVAYVATGKICFEDCGNRYTQADSDTCTSSYGGFDEESVMLLAISPAVVAFSNLIFGSFALCRVLLHNTYLHTDRQRNALATQLNADPEALEHHRLKLKKRLSDCEPEKSTCTTSSAVSEAYLSQEQHGLKQLTMLIKVVGLAFAVLCGLGYAGALMVWADNNIASMFVSLLGVFFVSFVLLTVSAFSRILHELGNWLVDLPWWRNVVNIIRSDWMRALVLCCMLPMLLPFLALCAANQCVRRIRGIADCIGDNSDLPISSDRDAPGRAFLKDMRRLLNTADITPEQARQLWLTPRVYVVIDAVRKLDLLSIFTKSYYWCLLPFAYYVGSLLFNAMFSLLRDLLSPVPFGLVIVLTFVVGVVAFLWPTIPGMVVYMFGGLLIPDTCTVPSGADRDTQFWVGVGINIILGFFLKLCACAVQQKAIGERLGKNVKVRQMCRIHTTQMRCIESVLRKPGLSLGKVAILCGGPDWPVSVLCGILGLSLLSCEIGTMPIILYVIPCALCGSMYLRAAEEGSEDGSGIWSTYATVTIFATTFVTGLLWVIMAWALQHEWELKSHELGKPIQQHVDLWFLDHKAEELARRCAMSWEELPNLLRKSFALGAVFQIMVSHAFVWGYNYLFGNFTVDQPWDNIVWLANSMDECGCYTSTETVKRRFCVFALGGVALTVLYFIGWVPFKLLYRWWEQRNAQMKKQLDEEFGGEYERIWCETFIKEKVEGTPKSAPEQPVAVGIDTDQAPRADDRVATEDQPTMEPPTDDQPEALAEAKEEPKEEPQEEPKEDPQEQPEVAELEPGQRVRIRNLTNSKDLNGRQGVLRELSPESGRWLVIDADGQEFNVKPENLVLEAAERSATPQLPQPQIRTSGTTTSMRSLPEQQAVIAAKKADRSDRQSLGFSFFGCCSYPVGGIHFASETTTAFEPTTKDQELMV
jgi:hypothetical protein